MFFSSCSKQCQSSEDFIYDEDLCLVDFMFETSEYTGLGVQIQTQCNEEKECFIKLPDAKYLSSNQVCGGNSHFHAVTVEYTCKGTWLKTSLTCQKIFNEIVCH